MSRLKENRIIHSERFCRRYGMPLSNYAMADLMLYREIEKRGFRIEIEESGGTAQCLDQLECTVLVRVKR